MARSTTKLIKFTNGEEIIADLTIKDGRATVKNPARFIISEQGIGAMPWVPLSLQKSFEFDVTAILFTADVEDEVRNAYSERFGSGIITAPAPTLKLSLDGD